MMADFDLYGDTDPNDVPDGEADRNALNHIAAGVFTSKANDQIGEWLHLPEWLDLPKVGRETLDAQIEANKDPKTQPRGADRVTNGLP